MRYVVKAVLSNPHHLEYGRVTVPFPIPNEEYDRMIELLEPLGIGDALRPDCQVEEVDSFYTILNHLIGTTVAFDELDYLANRLDSFDDGEAAQFQGMAHKLGLSNIKDLINLTFCCQQATVITDFSNLEQVGKDHYMNLHGSCAEIKELEDLDGEETAHLLISSGDGMITPYGVVYDNGMKLEKLYDGQHFPAYLNDANAALAVTISPKTEPIGSAHKTFLFLPVADGQIERAMVRAGIRNCEEMRIELEDWFHFKGVFTEMYFEHESLRELNEMARELAQLSDLDKKKLRAAAHIVKPYTAKHIGNLARQLDLFDFVPGVSSPEEYGRYMIRESGHFEYDENLDDIYDFGKYGRQRIEEEQGEFTPDGYISYHGDRSMSEVLHGITDGRLGFQMGGMR